MALIRWSPFATLPSLRSGWESFPVTTFRAPLDVQRTEGGYRLQAALPGFKTEDVDVTLEQGTLTITARRSEDRQAEQGHYLRREVFSGSYLRRLALPAEVTPEDITATLENGVLTVDVKHVPATRSVKIPVAATAPAALPEPEAKTEQPAA